MCNFIVSCWVKVSEHAIPIARVRNSFSELVEGGKVCQRQPMSKPPMCKYAPREERDLSYRCARLPLQVPPRVLLFVSTECPRNMPSAIVEESNHHKTLFPFSSPNDQSSQEAPLLQEPSGLTQPAPSARQHQPTPGIDPSHWVLARDYGNVAGAPEAVLQTCKAP